jgi:uncharacterized protein (DUF58 family)
MPTARGWGVLAATVVGYVGAATLGYAELAVIATGGALALILGRLWLLRPLPLRAHREIAPARVARGEPALGVLTLRHPGRRRTRPLRATDRCGDRLITVDIPRLRPGQGHTESYFLPTERRGEVRVGPVEVTIADPLHLFRRVRSYGQVRSLLVHPRTVSLATPPSGRAASVEGTTTQRAAGGTATFHALREYVFGDDLRHIHWRSTARTGALMVRELVDASRPTTTVLLDDRADRYAGDDFELAVEVVASVAVTGLRLGFPIVVVAGSTPLPAADPVALLDRLSFVHSGGTVPPRPPVRDANGSLVVVTGRATPAELEAMVTARRSYERTIVVRVGAELPAVPAGLTALGVTDLVGAQAGWHRLVPQ